MPENNQDDGGRRTRPYTSKQMGDACEMLVAGELTLAGIPALKVPDNWPDYDVIAQPRDGSVPQRISVKSRTFKRGGDTFVTYNADDQFEWLAVVLLPGDGLKSRGTFIIPRKVADAKSRHDSPTAKTNERYWRQDETAVKFAKYKDNFGLSLTGVVSHVAAG